MKKGMNPDKDRINRWTIEEHRALLEGLDIHGRNPNHIKWKKIHQDFVPSRTKLAVQSYGRDWLRNNTNRDEERRSITKDNIKVSNESEDGLIAIISADEGFVVDSNYLEKEIKKKEGRVILL